MTAEKQRRAAATAKQADAAEARLRQRASAAASSTPLNSFDMDDPVPAGGQERGEYFMKYIQMGEALLQRGKTQDLSQKEVAMMKSLSADRSASL